MSIVRAKYKSSYIYIYTYAMYSIYNGSTRRTSDVDLLTPILTRQMAELMIAQQTVSIWTQQASTVHHLHITLRNGIRQQ